MDRKSDKRQDFFGDMRDWSERYAASLVADFPRLFKGNEPVYGVSYGPGWDWILRQLVDSIDTSLDARQAARIHIDQIKEKFGGLRFYYGVGTSTPVTIDITHADGLHQRLRTPLNAPRFPAEMVDSLIADAEVASFQTCFFCGAAGVRRADGWIVVACEHCFDLRRRARTRSG